MTLAIERVLEILQRRSKAVVALLVRDFKEAEAADAQLLSRLGWSFNTHYMNRYHHNSDGAGVQVLTPFMAREYYKRVFDAVVQSCDYGDLPGPLIFTLKQYRTRKSGLEWWMSIDQDQGERTWEPGLTSTSDVARTLSGWAVSRGTGTRSWVVAVATS